MVIVAVASVGRIREGHAGGGVGVALVVIVVSVLEVVLRLIQMVVTEEVVRWGRYVTVLIVLFTGWKFWIDNNTS